MGEEEDKEKAEKLAAAKKRVAQLQKKKKAAGGKDKAGPSGKSAKSKAAEKPDADEASPAKAPQADLDEDEGDGGDPISEAQAPVADETPATSKPLQPESTVKNEKAAAMEEDDDEDTAAFNAAIQSAQQTSSPIQGDSETHAQGSQSPPLPSKSPNEDISKQRRPGRQPSVSLQSKIRSESFRHGPTASPVDESSDLPDIYRKQMLRIDELEKENKRLAKEAQESQSRWQKNEDELEQLREKATERQDPDNEEFLKLRSEIETLRRNSRHSLSVPKQKDNEVEHLRKEIESKESTINDMQLEISRLRSQIDALTTEGKNENEQIAALQSTLQKSETAATKLQNELSDAKKALSRSSEKAVLDGTERTSKEMKIKALEREVAESKSLAEIAEKRADSLSAKIDAMNKLHRETEQRNGPKLAQADAQAKELQMLKAKLESAQKENIKLREARKHIITGEGADDGLDELEDEERTRLEKRVRELEGENFDLRRGVWRDKRRELQPNLSLDASDNADGFDEVDLNGSGSATRKGSTLNNSQQPPAMQARHSGFTQVLNSGLAAFRASTTSPDSQSRLGQGRPRNDSLLEEFDDDAFDEGAFAAAQKEEEMRKMVEHVREIKKGLKQWQGFRLDLVDLRRSGGSGPGFGDIFEL